MADALIFDDAPYFVGFLKEILEDQGLDVKFFTEGTEALAHVRRESPFLVLLDVMMPGADGLTLCKAIKTDPALSWMKVVIVTGKAFADDKARAEWANADLFVEKSSFDIDDFSVQIRQLLRDVKKPSIGPPSSAETPRAGNPPVVKKKEPEAPRAPWKIRFWGQGAGSDCVSFIDRDRLVVVDAGAGLEALAREKIEPGVRQVWLLLTHFHQDHVKGLAHAKTWVEGGLDLHVVGPSDAESILALLVRRMLPFPSVKTHPLWEGAFDGMPGLPVSAVHTMHPGPCFAYRLGSGNRSVVIAPDSELPPAEDKHVGDNTEKLAAFASGAEALIHDARYSDKDYAAFAGRGHSCPRAALDLAVRAGVRTLVLCHTDAKYPPAEREKMLAELRSHDAPGTALSSCLLARNGLQLDL